MTTHATDSDRTDEPHAVPRRAVGMLTAAMLAAPACAAAGFFATALLGGQNVFFWPLTVPVVLCLSWFYLLVASQRDVTTVRTAVAMLVGVLVGAVLGRAHVLLFWRVAGIEPGGIATGRCVWTFVRAALADAAPHAVGVVVLAVPIVRFRGPASLVISGALVGGLAGFVHMALAGLGAAAIGAVAVLGGYVGAYAILLPLLAWLGDQIHPLSDRQRRQMRPAIACVWGIPAIALLVGGLVMPEQWPGRSDQAGLLPILLLLDEVRDIYYGYPHPGLAQHIAVCLIFLALAGGLCASGWWAWLPWVVWLLHDLLYATLLVWAAVMILSNVGASTVDRGENPLPATVWAFYSMVMGLAYVFALRAWTLTRRGVRPT